MTSTVDNLTELDMLIWLYAQDLKLLRPNSRGDWSFTFRAPYGQVYAHKTVDGETPTDCIQKAIRIQREAVRHT